MFWLFLFKKSETFDCFVAFKNMVENQTGLTIKRFRSDNGTEFVNKRFTGLFARRGIVHESSIDYTPQQNAVAERVNRTIIEKTRCMLVDADLPKQYWAETASTAIYLRNRCPTKALRGSIPEEVWSGKKSKVDLSKLRIFGCQAYAHVPDEKRKKLDKSRLLLFVGYCEHSKGYRLIDPKNPQKLIKSRDVIFNETKKGIHVDPVLDEFVFGEASQSMEVNVQSAENDPFNSSDVNQSNDDSQLRSSEVGNELNMSRQTESDESGFDSCDSDNGLTSSSPAVANKVPRDSGRPQRQIKLQLKFNDYHVYFNDFLWMIVRCLMNPLVTRRLCLVLIAIIGEKL